ncbi:hypothetical protein GCM10010909_14480 [Acidocella aquatica]|uniref:DUF2029 domain-containing protein n=1 Tax=Acidocella aquatica TaxID=1922313 RepID=A0ABQ6A971_9PROT|nr:glycosyltransferase family 87 protein [Acidocella aquatica]GLR66768.1 hypothetical protein GCM10010909_14480 [Acidocella aquatica]
MFWLIILVELVVVIIDTRIFSGQFGITGFTLPPDMQCFWANGALALHPGMVASAIAARICPFMYPPPFLMLAAPLSWLHPLAAFAAWTSLTALSLVLAGRALSLPWRVIGIGVLSPPGLLCATVGQTGMIVSALLLIGLGLADTSPLLAGIAAGCLVIKPQFAILFPIFFLASRNWRALGASAASAIIGCLVSLLFFGPGVWQQFFHNQIGLAGAVLARPWPQPFQHIMISSFILLRSLGAGLPMAYAVQFAVTAGAVFVAWMLWSSRIWRMAPLGRLVASLLLVMLATPYAYVYDLPALALALTGYALQEKPFTLLPLAIFFLVTGLYFWLAAFGWPPAGAFFLLLLLVFVLSHPIKIQGATDLKWGIPHA